MSELEQAIKAAAQAEDEVERRVAHTRSVMAAESAAHAAHDQAMSRLREAMQAEIERHRSLNAWSS